MNGGPAAASVPKASRSVSVVRPKRKCMKPLHFNKSAFQPSLGNDACTAERPSRPLRLSGPSTACGGYDCSDPGMPTGPLRNQQNANHNDGSEYSRRIKSADVESAVFD